MHANDKNIIDAAEKLVQIVNTEISSISECFECYKMISDHGDVAIQMVCSSNHPVIWAKAVQFGYWPAKAISFEENLVHLRYFGDQILDKVPVELCYQYSPEPPEDLRSNDDGINDELYADALKVRKQNKLSIPFIIILILNCLNSQEASSYIKNLEEKGVQFIAAENRKPFDPRVIVSMKSQLKSIEMIIPSNINEFPADANSSSNGEATTQAQTASNNTLLRPAVLSSVHNGSSVKVSDEAVTDEEEIVEKVADESQPPSKKARLKLDQKWYDSKQKLMTEAVNVAMLQAKECNAKSLKRINKLLKEVGLLKEERESLRKSKEEHEMQIKELQEENNALRKNAKVCRNCGKSVTQMLFCGINCQNVIE